MTQSAPAMARQRDAEGRMKSATANVEGATTNCLYEGLGLNKSLRPKKQALRPPRIDYVRPPEEYPG